MAVVGGQQEQQRKPTMAELMGGMMASRQKPTVSMPQIYPGSSQVPGVGGGRTSDENPIADAVMRGLERGAENSEWRKRQAILKQDDYERQDRQMRMERDEQTVTSMIADYANTANAHTQVAFEGAKAAIEQSLYTLDVLRETGAPPEAIEAAKNEYMALVDKFKFTTDQQKKMATEFQTKHKGALETYAGDPRVKSLQDQMAAAGDSLPLYQEALNGRIAQTAVMIDLSFGNAKTDAKRRQLVRTTANALSKMEQDIAFADKQANAGYAIAMGVTPMDLEPDPKTGEISPNAAYKITNFTSEFLSRNIGGVNDPDKFGPAMKQMRALSDRTDLSQEQKRVLAGELHTNYLVQAVREFVAPLNTPGEDIDHPALAEELIRGGGEDIPLNLRLMYSRIAETIGDSMFDQYQAALLPKGSMPGVLADTVTGAFWGTTEDGIEHGDRQAAMSLIGGIANAGRTVGLQHNATRQMNEELTRVFKPKVDLLLEAEGTMSPDEFEVMVEGLRTDLKATAQRIMHENPVAKANLTKILGQDPENGMFLPLREQPALNYVAKPKLTPGGPITQSPAPSFEDVGAAAMGGAIPDAQSAEYMNSELPIEGDPRFLAAQEQAPPQEEPSGVLEQYARLQRTAIPNRPIELQGPLPNTPLKKKTEKKGK